jgi:PDZ domain-containing protein
VFRLAALGLLVATLAGAVLGSAKVPSPYSVVRPGGVYELSSRMTLQEDHRRDSGWLALTAVKIRPASVAEWVTARFEPGAEIVQTTAVRPADLSDEEYTTVKLRWMDGSKRVAALLASDRAGYLVRPVGRGLLVERVQRSGPAAGQLLAGDVILRIEGRAVGDSAALRRLLDQYPVGQELRLTVIRKGTIQRVSVRTAESSVAAGRTMLGISTSPFLTGLSLPFRYRIDTTGISGPSGGLMLSLALLDALTEGDLTGGHRVAGTGTVDPEGRVGSVGSVGSKVVAAERGGAEIFLVPAANIAEASAASRTLQLVPVKTFDDAIAALERLGGERKLAGAALTDQRSAATSSFELAAASGTELAARAG